MGKGALMIQSWILSKLTPLLGQPVIILRDPQRMIISGAQVVDGWAEEHGYTVLFCNANLALREMYESIREVTDAKILLVDRTRAGTLFYPDLQAKANQEAVLSLSLREFLIEQTGDQAWPKLVDGRDISGLLLEDVPATLKAYQDLRSVAPNRFSDSDLHKIALGSALKINPFKKLSPSEIRRLCIEQHTILEGLKGRLPEDIIATLGNEIAKAPKPFCWLLERDPDLVMRAFTLAAILRQHKLDYRLLLANIDPLLHDYKDIETDFLDGAVQDLLQSDPERVLQDVRAVEDLLRKNPQSLSLILRDQLQLDDPAKALAVLKNERLSNLVRCLALASLLVDLILKKEIKFHQKVENEIRKQEEDANNLALRRPSEQWQALTNTYRRAISVYQLTALLSKFANQAKVLQPAELEFEFFHTAWNQEKLNRLDFFLSELDRLLRVGDILPVSVEFLWPEMAKRWAEARQAFELTNQAVQRALDLINARFQDFYRLHYTKWIQADQTTAAIPVIFTHQFLPRLLKPYWDPGKGQKAIVLVFDGMRTDAWAEFLHPLLEERYQLIHSQAGSAILPTETQLSRKAISAGKLPADFPPGSRKESELLKAWCKENLDWTPDFQIVCDRDTEATGMVVRYTSPRLDYIVFNFSDENLHHNQNELALIYRSVVNELIQQEVRSVLRDLPDDALIFVTSDHGFTPMPSGIVNLPSTMLVDDHDVKYRNARTLQKLSGPDVDKTLDFDVRVMGIPATSPSVRNTAFNYVLFPRPGYIFKRPRGPHAPDRYSHGGLSMAECLVPMAVYGPRPAFQPLLQLEGIEQVGSISAGEMLELEIVLKSSQHITQEIPFTLTFNRQEIPTRKEVFSGSSKAVTVRWSPSLGEIPAEARQKGDLILPVSVQLAYRDGERLVRASQAVDVRIKLDTNRLHRRLDSKLDLLMGKVPKELKG